jgi:hypothetical protein
VRNIRCDGLSTLRDCLVWTLADGIPSNLKTGVAEGHRGFRIPPPPTKFLSKLTRPACAIFWPIGDRINLTGVFMQDALGHIHPRVFGLCYIPSRY